MFLGRILCLLASATLLLLVSDVTSNDVKLLCANKKVELTRLEQVNQIVHQLDKDCPRPTRRAIHEFKLLVTDDGKREICSQEKANQIQDHVRNVLANKDYKYPRSLKKLLIAYGMKISGLCRARMIDSLMAASSDLLASDDFATMDSLTGEGSLIARLLGTPGDDEALVLPKDLGRLLNSDSVQQSDNEKVFLHAKTGGLIKNVQALCQNKFKPIYGELILPLVTLSNVGFGHMDNSKVSNSPGEDVNKRIHQWYRIVFLCEFLESVALIEDQAEHQAEGSDKRMVKIYSKEEVEQLKQSNPKALENEYLVKHDKIDYKPKPGPTLSGDEPIYSPGDEKILKAVRNYKLPKLASQSRGLRKMMSLVKDKLASGAFKVIGSYYASRRGGNNLKAAVSTEIVHEINDLVNDLEAPDRPVGNGGQRMPSLKQFNAQFHGSRFNVGFNYNNESKVKHVIRRHKWKILFGIVVIILVSVGLSFLG